MSGVGGIGGLGAIGAVGAGLGAGGVPSIGTGGLNGPLGNANAAAITALSGTRIGELLKLMDGFSSAEILIALLMSGNHHRHHCGSDDALGFLIGMSLAAQLGQSCLAISGPAGIPGSSAPTGQMINFMA